MRRHIRAGALLAFALLVALPATAATAKDMYAAAVSRAKTLREDDGGRPSLRDYRAAAEAFEAVVRRYPTTGYADNALLEAASLAREAHERFGNEQDKATAVRLLNWVVSEYPASPLVSRARSELKRLSTAAPTPVKANSRPDAAPAAAAAGQGNVVVLKDVRRTVIGDIVRVTIELDAEVAYHTERVENPARVLFDLESTRLGPSVAEGSLSYPDVVRHIRVGRHPNRVVRVVLDLEGVKKYSVFTLYGPYRIVIDCERGPVLPPVPVQRVAEERVRAPIPDPAEPGEPEPPPQPKAEALARTVAPSPRAAVPAKPAPAPPPPAPRVLASRTMPTSRIVMAPQAVPQPVVLPPTPPVRVAQTAPSPAPVIPLKITRQFRMTRYPAWQPVVLTPQEPRIDSLAAAAPSSTAAASPAVAERSSPSAGKAALEKPAAASEPITPPPNGFSMARQLGLGAARIVIDPGHGGHDPGAEGPGVFEAQIVLDVALRLEKLLTAAGIEAVLTRRGDEYIPLEERTAIANRAHGDLFLSIHANASRNRTARGVESYVLNFATTPDAEAVAARENASTGLTMSSLTEIVKAIALNNKLDESRNFAGIIQREMAAHLGGSNRDVKNLGVKQAPFVVLIGASMPSVLAEISFITNSQEGRLLKTGGYRQKVAEALFDAIRGYQKSLKGSAVLTRQ